MKNLLNLLLIVLLLGSCSKEIIEQEAKSESQNFRTIEQIVTSNDSDMLLFESTDEYDYFVVEYEKLDVDNKSIVLNSINYTTLEDKISKLVDEMETFIEEVEFDAFVSRNSSLFKYEIMENGDKMIVEKDSRSSLSIFPFINEKGLIKIGDQYVKFVEDQFVFSEDKTKLDNIENLIDVERNELRSSLSYQIQNADNQSRWGDAGVEKTWKKTKDVSWCKHDRRLKLVVLLAGQFSPGSNQDCLLVVTGYAKVTNFKKGIPCIWFWGTTKITWNNFKTKFRLNLYGSIHEHSWSGPDKFENTYRIERDKIIEHIFSKPGQDCFWDAEWHSVKSNIHTGPIGWWNFSWTL